MSSEPAVALVGAPEDPDVPGWRRPPITADQRREDLLLAGGLLVGSLLSLAITVGMYDDPAPAWVAMLCLGAMTVPLAWRRRWPGPVAVVVAAVFIAAGLMHVSEQLFSNISLFVALYTVGAWEHRRAVAAWVRIAIVVAMFLWVLGSVFQAITDPDAIPGLSRAGAFSPLVSYLLVQVLTNILYFAGAYYFGDHAWAAARERARTAWRGRLLTAERRRAEEQAVAIERLRIARELHDAVAHHVSMMGVQAAAARTVLSADATAAAVALEHVEESAREAIRELHGVLGTLRAADPDPRDAEAGAALASLTVEQIPVLVERSAEGGTPAQFQVVGEPVPLPPLVSLNLYRIAQEALTNARRHAGVGARVDVRLRYAAEVVELEVADDGAGVRRGRMPSSGLGQVGMRERVAADGGTLEVGPRGRGGYLVRARVPLAGPRDLRRAGATGAATGPVGAVGVAGGPAGVGGTAGVGGAA
ncbi:MAG TPA: histidine kinase [Cellulomonas sp.]